MAAVFPDWAPVEEAVRRVLRAQCAASCLRRSESVFVLLRVACCALRGGPARRCEAALCIGVALARASPCADASGLLLCAQL